MKVRNENVPFSGFGLAFSTDWLFVEDTSSGAISATSFPLWMFYAEITDVVLKSLVITNVLEFIFLLLHYEDVQHNTKQSEKARCPFNLIHRLFHVKFHNLRPDKTISFPMNLQDIHFDPALNFDL